MMSAAHTDFLFIRHGETAWNREHRFQGQSNPPLNETGCAQARRLGERLAGRPADVLVSSDLLRAQQTAEPMRLAWALPLHCSKGLREQAFGALEGWTVPQVQSTQPLLWARWLEQDADFALPEGGESQRQFQARVLAEVADLAQRFGPVRIAVVTHGGVLDMLWRAAHGLPLSGLRQCEIPNTGLNRLRWEDGRLSVLSWADAAHVTDLPPLSPYSPATLSVGQTAGQ